MSMSRNAGLQICSMMMLPQLPFVAAAITLSSKVTFLPFLSLGAVFYIFTAFAMWSLIYARIPDKILLRQQEAQEPPQECRAPESRTDGYLCTVPLAIGPVKSYSSLESEIL